MPLAAPWEAAGLEIQEGNGTQEMNGYLIIDKKAGMSSYDVIRRLKRLHKSKKIGYIGTLDRNATGILPVAINEGVKLIPFLENVEKQYRAKFLLGVTTETQDIEGKVLTETATEPFDRQVIEDSLKAYLGKITQRVPAYSSKKVNRKPLYKWAERGAGGTACQGGGDLRHRPDRLHPPLPRRGGHLFKRDVHQGAGERSRREARVRSHPVHSEADEARRFFGRDGDRY